MTSYVQTTTNITSPLGRTGSLGGHATRLKIQSRQVAESQNKNGGPVPENSIGKGRQRQSITHLIVKDALIPKGIGAIVNGTAGADVGDIAAVQFGVVAASIGNIFAGHTLVLITRGLIGIDISRKSHRWRRRGRIGILNEPKGAHNTARPAHDALCDVRISDRTNQENDTFWMLVKNTKRPLFSKRPIISLADTSTYKRPPLTV